MLRQDGDGFERGCGGPIILRGPQQVLGDIFGKKRRLDQIEYGTKALRRTNVYKAGKYAVQVRGYTNW